MHGDIPADPREQVWIEQQNHHPGQDLQELMSSTGTKVVMLTKMPQPIPSYRHQRCHFPPVTLGLGRAVSRQDEFAAQLHTEPLQGGCSGTPLCKLNHCILWSSAAAPAKDTPQPPGPFIHTIQSKRKIRIHGKGRYLYVRHGCRQQICSTHSPLTPTSSEPG